MVDLPMPYDESLERTIISSMIFEPTCIADAADILKPEYFHHSLYRKLCEEVLRLWNEDESRVNPVEMIPFLEKHNIPIEAVTSLISDMMPSTKVIRYHAERLQSLASLRKAVQLGRQLASMYTLKDKDEIREMLNQVELRLSGIAAETAQMDTIKRLEDVLMETNEEFHFNYEKGDGITGLPTGFADLDDLTSGLRKKDLIILAGRPSMGKSAFAIQIAQYMKYGAKKNGVIFNLEMDRKSMAYRIMANMGKLDLLKLRSGMVNEKEYLRYTETMRYLMSQQSGELFLDEQPGMTVSEMKAKARKIQREYGLDYIIIDYLGLIRGSRQYMNRVDEVSEISRLLKVMAKELDVPVIALCQLSRAVEQRQDKRPMLSDLRESGSIEQDADLVMFLYRDDYYNPDSEKKNIAELIVAKHRNGPVGKVEMLFAKEYNLFLPLDRRAMTA
jgi:replicative DNA helicase